MAAIKGHQTEFRILEDGNIVDIIEITKFSRNQDANMSRAYYVGKKVGVGDQTHEGWSGSIDMEVANAKVEDFIDGLITGIRNGIGRKDYALVDTELYDDGTSRSYVYNDCQFKLTKDNGGLTEKVTKKLDWQASDRTKL